MHDRATQFKALDKTIAAEQKRHRPALVKGMTEFVYKQGRGASFNARSWQAIARALYGKDFVTAFKRLVRKRS